MMARGGVPVSTLHESETRKPGDYSIEQLIERARYMRGLDLISLCSAGSGHSGGTLGIMDICAALYLRNSKT